MDASELDQLRPTERNRVIDLVEAAGLDVSDWANFEGGAEKAASNPKYCYEWAFEAPGHAIVVNLWYEDMRQLNDTVSVSFTLKDPKVFKGVRKTRADKLLHVIAHAHAGEVPLRVIVNAGKAGDAL